MKIWKLFCIHFVIFKMIVLFCPTRIRIAIIVSHVFTSFWKAYHLTHQVLHHFNKAISAEISQASRGRRIIRFGKKSKCFSCNCNPRFQCKWKRERARGVTSLSSEDEDAFCKCTSNCFSRHPAPFSPPTLAAHSHALPLEQMLMHKLPDTGIKTISYESRPVALNFRPIQRLATQGWIGIALHEHQAAFKLRKHASHCQVCSRLTFPLCTGSSVDLHLLLCRCVGL